MSVAPPKCSGWRIRGKQKYENEDCVRNRYYLSITCRKFFKQNAAAACRRDKRILGKEVLTLMKEVKLLKTVIVYVPI